MSKVSVVIPSRNERFLAPTVKDVLKNASGDVEVIVVLDGYWPNPPLEADNRLIQVHWGDRFGKGMRPGINAAIACSRGNYVMKLDGHCSLGRGWDEILKQHCEDDWLVVPRRLSLEPETWTIKKDRPVVDAHYLSYPYARPGDRTCGLHGNVWKQRAVERSKIPIDDEMSSQGSCWFTTRKHWDRLLGPMEVHNYGTFAQEFQELGMKTWLSGGRVVVNKNTHYAHLHKGKQYGTGYGFSNQKWREWAEEKERARLFCVDHWMNNRWEERKHDIDWLIDKFWPVPGWPEDWRTVGHA
jgi:glycosyltransferase involved in cell wall biosynthesis